MVSLKKSKTPVQKKTMKHEKVQLYTISLFLFSSFVDMVYLYFWILFQFCGLILYFFVCVSGWGCLFPYRDLCFCFLVVFFCFGFPFCLMSFCFGFVLSYFCCCCCFLVVFCFYRPPYIFDSPLHLNPTTGEHFKLRRKFLHRYQIVQVRNNLL